MMRNFKILFFISILLFCFVAFPAQKKTETDIYADVPADKRERFIERLNTFFQYYRERNKDKVYDMLGEQAKQYVVGGLSRGRFLKEVYLLKLKKFEVKEVAVFVIEKKEPVEYVVIYGCGEYSRFGSNKKKDFTACPYGDVVGQIIYFNKEENIRFTYHSDDGAVSNLSIMATEKNKERYKCKKNKVIVTLDPEGFRCNSPD